MPTKTLLAALILTLVTAAAQPVRAQDLLAPILQKPKLSLQEVSTIKAEIGLRAKKLVDAGPDLARQKKARERFIKTAHTSGASKEGINTYIQACAAELGPLIAGPDFDPAFSAALVLVDLKHLNTTEALAGGLASPHAAARYLCARGILQLHKELKTNRSLCDAALHALGTAAAAEQQSEPTRRMIFQAMDFLASASDFQYRDLQIAAFNEALAGRVKQLAQGARLTAEDVAALHSAAACYRSASDRDKSALAANLRACLNRAVELYSNPGASAKARTVFASHITKIESLLHDIIRESKVKPPSAKVADALKTPGPSRPAQLQSAIEQLNAVLHGDPWNL